MKTTISFLMALCLMVGLTMHAQTSVVVTPGSGTLETAYNSASSGDTLILKNGEQYNISSHLYIDKKITIMAESKVLLPELDSMPLIYNTYANNRMFRLADNCDLNLIGIDVDGNNGYYIFEPAFEIGMTINLYINRCRLHNTYDDILTSPGANNYYQAYLQSFIIENSFLYDAQGHGMYTKDYEGGENPWIFRNITYWNMGEQLTWIRAYPEDSVQQLIFDHITGYDLSSNTTENKELFGNSDNTGEASLDIDVKNSIFSNQLSTNSGSFKFDNTSGRHDISLSHLLLHDVRPIDHLGGTLYTNEIDSTSNPQFYDPDNRDFTVMNSDLYDAADDGEILGAIYWHPEFVDSGEIAKPEIFIESNNILFGTLYTNRSKSEYIQIHNFGNETLIFDTAIIDNHSFTLAEEIPPIAAKQSRTVQVDFYASEPGSYEGDLLLVNNSDNDSIFINLSALAINPPVMTVTPDAINEVLLTGNDLHKQIVIENDSAGSQLDYFIEIKDFNPANQNWLEIDTIGSLEAGETEIVHVQFKSSGIPLGVYTAKIYITGTDSINNHKIIPVELEITDNRAPLVAKPVHYITDYITMEQTTIYLDTIFSDPDGDALQFEHVASNDSVVNFLRNGNKLTLQYNKPGTTKIYLQAADIKNFTAADTFTIEVLDNHVPTLQQAIEDMNQNMNESEFVNVSLTSAFHDEDGDDLYFSVKSSNTNVVDYSSFDSTDTELIIVGKAVGFAIIDISASDGKSLQKAKDKFVVTFEDTPITSIEAHLLTNGMSVFPNPARNTLNVVLEHGERTQLEIYNSTGIRVLSTQVAGDHITIDISDLKPGIYLVRTNRNDKGLQKLIIK